MKRSNHYNTAQSLLHFPSGTHDAPRQAATVNQRISNGTAFISVKNGLVEYRGFTRRRRGKSLPNLVPTKHPVEVKEYRLSDKPGGVRHYPAYMSDSVKVRMLFTEFRTELPYLVRQLTDYCSTLIAQQDTIQRTWPARYVQDFPQWLMLVERVYEKINDCSEYLNAPGVFARLLMRGKAQAVVVNFILKFRPRQRGREFSRLVQQFFS